MVSMEEIEAWKKEEKTVTMTRDQWSKLTTYLLISTSFREGERTAYEKLALETNKDGTCAFNKAAHMAKFWKETNEDIEKMIAVIDGR